MSKLIYITERQLNEIIGNGAYLNDGDTTNEYRFGGAEVTVDGTTGNYVDGDVEFGEPVTTDEFARGLVPQRSHWSRGAVKSPIREANQDLSGKGNTFQISSVELDKLKQRLNSYGGSKNDAGFKRGQTLVNKGRISYDDAYRVLDDMNTGTDGAVLDPDGTLKNELERKINTGTNISKSGRESKMNMGQNVMKSAPKTGAKGGAHTPKGNNVIGVSYE